MSVTIDSPEGTLYISATLHLCTEADVKEWAEDRGVSWFYLPNEADATMIASNACVDDRNNWVSAVARVV